MSDVKDVKELIERLRASGTANAPRNSKGIYMSICDDAATALERLSAERDEAREALRWYEEQARNCRKLGSAGDPARHALDADGGKRARAALKAEPVEP